MYNFIQIEVVQKIVIFDDKMHKQRMLIFLAVNFFDNTFHNV